ncbi:TonB-dependent receptor [Xanthocytophaga agilis]|uniref:TonB-dependent receptor n=1 Tax=Xanthocytophaga agilis TaxID=3048010 RepID=A0AAE3R8U6_9BACT|nr:TonB-dependent receptor [Xanthocytophaga agilis]MDJ1503697.1 TonB-dependent receptor [Xanthocytophaga agilis]
MKHLNLVLLLLFSISVYAQKGILRGTIKTVEGQVAPSVTVTLKGSNAGTVTDEKGNYTLRANAGTYTLQASIVGFTPQEKEVTVEAGKTTQVDEIRLQESAEQLQEVVVTGNTNKFSKKESPYVSRLPIKNLENPQVYNVIGKELITEQVITNFNDIVKNSPGIDKLWSATGRGGDGAAYFSIRGFAVQPSMINGIAGLTNGGLDPANIESVEVIKGPSGTLFGSSLVSFGGLININTKKPYETAGGEISYTMGGYDLNRLSVDVNTPVNKEKTLLLRVNGAYQYEGSFQDAGFKRTMFVAPSISYKVSNKLSFLLNAEFYNSEATNPLMVFLNRGRELIAKTPAELNMDYSQSFTSNDITLKNPTVNLYGQMNYKLSNSWTSQTSFSRSIRKSDGLYSYAMFIGADDDTLSRFVGLQNSIGTTTDLQQNFIGDFNLGSMRNRIVMGIDIFNSQLNDAATYTYFDKVSVHGDPGYSLLTKQAVDAKVSQDPYVYKYIYNTYVYSAYVSDVLNLTENLLAMASVRVDRFDNKGVKDVSTNTKSGDYAQTAVSPKLGLIYQVVKDRVSLFANYMNGFQNVAPSSQPDGSIRVFKPTQANQIEGGVKLEALKGKLVGTISYYNIYVSNVVRADNNGPAGTTIQNGDMYSRGFETDITFNPVTGLHIIAGYSHNESINENTDAIDLNRRPINAGPKTLANLWLSYAITNGNAKGLGFGVGGNYASENKVSNNATIGVFTVPSYTILNATTFYSVRSFRFALKLDNITNQHYWKGWSTIEPQMLRRLSANVVFKF